MCTTRSIDELKNLIIKLDENNLNQNGNMLFAYLWGIDFNDNDYDKNWHEIYKMPITRERLNEYITKSYKIRSSEDILWNENNNRDLILVYTKK